MATQEAEFIAELEAFRRDGEEAAQFLFAYLAVHETAKRSQRVFQMLDRHAMFWNTALGALEYAALIALGRTFETNSAHNIGVLIRLAQTNQSIFSSAALARRKQGAAPVPPDWLPDYMKGIREPKVRSFRALRSEVAKHRAVYEARYRDIRHKVVAHSEAVDAASVAALFANTSVVELQRLVVFPLRVYAALWHLYYNGGPLVLRRFKYSAPRMVRATSSSSRNRVQEAIVKETVEALRDAARPNERMEPTRRSRRAIRSLRRAAHS